MRSVMRDEGAELMRALLVLRAGRGSKHHFASPKLDTRLLFCFFLYDQDSQATGENEKKNQCERENNRRLLQIRRNNNLRCH